MALFRRRRWPWVAAVAAVLALVAGIWFLARGDGPATPFDYDATTTPGVDLPDPTTPPPVPLSSVAGALKAHVEQGVTATATVQSRVGPSVAWVTTDQGQRVLLLLVSTEHPFAFAAGTAVTFTGTIKAATPGFGSAIGLRGADLEAFERQGAYVEVESYSP